LRHRFLPFIVPLVPILTSFVMAQPAPRAESRRLLVICVAGLDARFLAYPATRVKIPNIRKMMRNGVVSDGVVGVAPSDTVASETSLVTGTLPLEREAGLPALAAKRGFKVATVYWPNTSGAGQAFDFPQVSQNLRDVPFEAVASKSSPAGVIDKIEKAAPGFQKQLWDDASASAAAIWILQNRKADVLFVQLTDIDSEQRDTGALGIYSREALENDDEFIGRMQAAAPQGTIVVLVSGHGFENENYVVRPNVLLKGAHFEIADGLIGTSDRSVADRMRQVMNDGRRHGVAREVSMAEVKAKAPALGNWVAAFDTPQNYVANAEDHGPALGSGTHKGVSGLWPMRPGYRSVFMLAGQGIAPRKLGEIDILQIGPTLGDALGVKLSHAKARSLWPSIAN
jgi:hypothetical protein